MPNFITGFKQRSLGYSEISETKGSVTLLVSDRWLVSLMFFLEMSFEWHMKKPSSMAEK